MGRLEEESKKRTRRKNLKKIILSTVKTAGVLSFALVAPNALKLLKNLGFNPLKRQKEFINNSLGRLSGRGLIEIVDNKVFLTPNGESLLRRLELNDFKLKKPKSWDGKWRLLIFDIPEPKKILREKIREMLIMIGFSRLQDSVWIYPYDCEDVVKLFKTDLRIGKEVIYMIVESIEYDRDLKKHFKL